MLYPRSIKDLIFDQVAATQTHKKPTLHQNWILTYDAPDFQCTETSGILELSMSFNDVSRCFKHDSEFSTLVLFFNHHIHHMPTGKVNNG